MQIYLIWLGFNVLSALLLLAIYGLRGGNVRQTHMNIFFRQSHLVLQKKCVQASQQEAEESGLVELSDLNLVAMSFGAFYNHFYLFHHMNPWTCWCISIHIYLSCILYYTYILNVYINIPSKQKLSQASHSGTFGYKMVIQSYTSFFSLVSLVYLFSII